MRTVTLATFTAMMLAVVGTWGIASMNGNALNGFNSTFAAERIDVIQLTLNAKDLPVERYDAI